MNSLIKIDDIYVTRQKAVYSSVLPNGIVYPVSISFSKEIDDDKLGQLAAFAKWIQDKEDKIGHWIKDTNSSFFMCSVCNCSVPFKELKNHCPECGALMDGERREDDAKEST